EAGQGREAALRQARLAAQQEPAAVRTRMFDEHERHGIDAREVLRGASRTIALPTALGGLGELAALRAETVARMPVDHRARLAVDCELGSGEARYLRPCRTMRVGGAAVAARRNFGERGAPVEQAEEDELGLGGSLAGVAPDQAILGVEHGKELVELEQQPVFAGCGE